MGMHSGCAEGGEAHGKELHCLGDDSDDSIEYMMSVCGVSLLNKLLPSKWYY